MVVVRGFSFALVLGLTAACGAVPPRGDASGGSGGSGGSGNNANGGSGNNSNGGSGNSAGAGASSQTCSSGDQRSCYESPEGMSYGEKPPEGQQTCRVGVSKCGADGGWEPCVGAVGPLDADTCDPGNDATCNGIPNEGCACKSGETRACGSDVGNCKQGTQTCADQKWGECVGEVKPAAADTCDEGDDANCDDKPNDGCTCLNGKTMQCGTDIGPCEFGTLTCTNGVWPDDSQCLGGVKPAAADTCEPNNDANCNNTPNEKCKCTGAETKDCGVNVGACKYGTQTCDGGVLSTCMGGVNPTASDTCTGRDPANDTNCNGLTGDGCECVASDGPAACGDSGCGTKACDGATGKYKACAGDNVTVRCNPNDTTKRQVCGVNGVFVAKDCAATEQCTGQGVCKLKDGQTCASGSACAAGSCNSFYKDADNDGYKASGAALQSLCGVAVDGFVAAASNKGTDCDDAKDTINPGKAELCDGVDNDCDDLIDYADTVSFPLGGTNKANVTGRYGAIASSGGAYGILHYKQSTFQLQFSTLTQANALGTVKNIVLGDDTVSNSTLAFDGTNFGVFFRNGFQTVSPTNGTLGTKVTMPDPAGALERWMSAYMPGQYFIRVGHSSYGSALFSYADRVKGAATASLTVTSTAINYDIAVSGTTYGMVWQDGTPDPKIILNLRKSDGTEAASQPPVISQLAGNSNPVIAPRAGGGFVIVWAAASNKIVVREVTTAGAAICGNVEKTLVNFKPEQMVPTSRGYLVVSGAGNMVQAQEILPNCVWGGTLPVLGNTSGQTHPRIAAGSNGFGVIWDNDFLADSNIYTRTFGPNFCD
jgi:hypothetical protein